MEPPRSCRAKPITVVVPPTAAEAVPLAKLSAFTVGPARGSSMWTWLSMPPGSTSRPVEVPGGRHQVLRAGLAPDLEAAPLRPLDLLRALAARDVEDLDRHVECLRHLADAVDALALDDHRLGPGMVLGQGEPRRDQRLGVEVDQLMMLGMDADQRAEPPRGGHHLQRLAIGNAGAGIGEEDLEAAMPLGDQAGNLLGQDLRPGSVKIMWKL